MHTQEMPVPRVPKDERSADDKMIRDMTLFIRDNGFTADQVRRAYYRLLGDTETESDSSVEVILAKMKEFSDVGFPVNRFATLVGVKQEVEDGKIICFRHIESLPVSDSEKRLLRSIIELRRNGQVFFHSGGQEFASFKVNIKKEASTEVFALELHRVLGEIEAALRKNNVARYEISFIED